MSGHSKWSTIKRTKGVNDQKRGMTFTKISNLITVAAKSGGGDPDANPRLRQALDDAKAVNMPKENINRAIDRGLGKLPGMVIEEIVYEGYGPYQTAFIVEGATDNKNRTNSEIKNLFERSGGNLVTPGAVSFMFDRLGQISIVINDNPDEDILKLIDLGVVEVEELGNQLVVYVLPDQTYSMSSKITQAGYQVSSTSLVYKPINLITLTEDEQLEKVENFINKLSEHDDITQVFTNAELMKIS